MNCLSVQRYSTGNAQREALTSISRVDSFIEKPFEHQGAPSKDYIQKVLSDLHNKITHDNVNSNSTGLLRHGHSEHFSYSSLNQGPNKSGTSMLAAYPNPGGFSGLLNLPRNKPGYVKIDRSILGKTQTGMRPKVSHGSS